MNAAYAIVKLDARGIARDHVAVAILALSLLGTLVVTALGLFRDRLPGGSEWFPLVVAVTVVGAPGGVGFLFGLLMVDEGDTGVRQALAVSPVRPTVFLLVRTVLATAWTAAWPLVSVYLMCSTWQAVDLPFAQWLAVVGPLALLTPAFALLIPTLASDKVGALAVFKGLSFLSLMPLALFFVPEGAWYRLALLVSPTALAVEAYRAFLEGLAAAGFRWAAGAAGYALVLVAVVVRTHRRRAYRLHR